MATLSLIVNADDLGISPKRDEGIFHCFDEGIVTSASLMVNGLSVHSAVAGAASRSLPLGLHLNLTEGAPVGHAPSLLADADSAGNAAGAATVRGKTMRGKVGFREALANGRISVEDLLSEISAQVKLFIATVGRPPIHVDGHQHVHVLPGVAETFAKVLVEEGVQYTRVPHDDISLCTWMTPFQHEFYTGVTSQALTAARIFEQVGLLFPRHFRGMAVTGSHCSVVNVEDVVQGVIRDVTAEGPSSTMSQCCELMVHPGYRDDVWDEFNCSKDREHELQVLTDPKLVEWLASRVDLVAYLH